MIGAYLKDIIAVVRHGVRDQYGSEGPTTDELTHGFVQWKTKLVLNIKGEQVLSSANILMGYDPTITHEDKVKIDGVEHLIIAIERMRDLTVRGMRIYIQ